MGSPAGPERVGFFKRLIALRAADRSIPLDQFCRRHGISAWTYYHWRKRLSAVPATVSGGMRRPFVRVRLDACAVQAGGFELLFPNGIILRTATSLDRRAITEIAAAGVE